MGSVFLKDTEDDNPWQFDFTDALPTSRTIASASLVVTPSASTDADAPTATVTSKTDTTVNFTLAGGLPNRVYVIKCLATLDDDSILVANKAFRISPAEDYTTA